MACPKGYLGGPAPSSGVRSTATRPISIPAFLCQISAAAEETPVCEPAAGRFDSDFAGSSGSAAQAVRSLNIRFRRFLVAPVPIVLSSTIGLAALIVGTGGSVWRFFQAVLQWRCSGVNDAAQ